MSAQSQYNLTREPISSLWIGKPLTAVERLCIASFLANGHPFHLYVYEEIGNIPAGTTICDAREILPESKIFFHRKSNSVMGFSDIFRYELLLKHGGWWVDMDVICLRPLDFSEKMVFGRHEKEGILSGIIKFPPKHPLMRDVASRAHHPFSPFPWSTPLERWRLFWRRFKRGNSPTSIKPGQIGPKLFENALTHYQLMSFSRPAQYFYPVPMKEWLDVFDGTLEGGMSRLDSSYTIHLWNETMRSQDFDKNARFPANSVFEQLRAKYDPLQ